MLFGQRLGLGLVGFESSLTCRPQVREGFGVCGGYPVALRYGVRIVLVIFGTHILRLSRMVTLHPNPNHETYSFALHPQPY